MESNNLVVRAENLSKSYGKKNSLYAVKDVDLTIMPNRIVGLVGKSGSGKSTLGKLLAGIISPTSGRVLYGDKRLVPIGKKRRKPEEFPVQMVFQNAYASFNEIYQFKILLSEAVPKGDMYKIVEMMDNCGLPESYLYRYPYELSGGQLQRMAIARALLTEPRFLIADEVVSSLDLPVRLQILKLIKRISMEKGISILFISHDPEAVNYLSDEILTMNSGCLVK